MAEVGIFSFVDWGPIAVMVGGVFAALTVNKKSIETVSIPSLTVRVMVVVPVSSVAGVMTILRSASVPLRAILVFGTSVVFEEVAETDNSLGSDSGSPIVKLIAVVGVFAIVDWGPIGVIVGGASGNTVSMKLVDA
jgi:hypothetical protein